MSPKPEETQKPPSYSQTNEPPRKSLKEMTEQ